METIEKTIEVEAPLTKVYQQWTHFEQFPSFMQGVVQVKRLDETHLHWVANVGGHRKEWDAEILEQIPDQRIAWRSTSGAPNSGTVQFYSKDPRHTLIQLQLNYEPEGAIENLANALGAFSHHIEEDLKRFRNLAESSAESEPSPARTKVQPGGQYGTSGLSGIK